MHALQKSVNPVPALLEAGLIRLIEKVALQLLHLDEDGNHVALLRLQDVRDQLRHQACLPSGRWRGKK